MATPTASPEASPRSERSETDFLVPGERRNEFSARSSSRPILQPSQSSIDDPDLEARDAELMIEFDRMASRGELCVYTCIALIGGREGYWHSRTKQFVLQTLTLVALQIVVPLMLISYQARHFSLDSDVAFVEYRIIGVIMYVYSVYNIYDNSIDDCRTVYLELAIDRRLHSGYLAPAVFGELVNLFCGVTCVITLFTIYVIQRDPFNLVINCLAINFLGNVDNSMAHLDLQEEAVLDFKQLARQKWNEAQSSGFRVRALRCLARSVTIGRPVAVLVLGYILGGVFLVNNETILCGWSWSHAFGEFCEKFQGLS